ncbi:MAG: prenyltransferase [Acidimicrobiales bacterium]
MRSIPDVPGVISADQVLATARSIASVQRPDGMIEWFPGGHCDPWNHVEAAMALTVAGFDAEADLAYHWLVDTQLPDGSWFNYYLATGIEDARLDTNVCAYLATGAWHRYVSTGDLDALEKLWPTLERAIDFVLRWPRLDGSIRWSLDPSGFLEEYALLTGSSSIYHSLRCAIACAERLDHEQPDWEFAAGRLAHALSHEPSAFAPKEEFAMDWYYPVLAGALTGEAARRRIEESWSTFVMPGRGVRCVSTGEWVTAAETAECVLALDAVGLDEQAMQLFTWAQALRNGDGTYWTGMVYPEEVTYPPLERSSYTAGAIVLAADALSRTTPASGIFRGEGLPSHLDLTEPAPEAPVEPSLPAPGTPGTA